MREIEKKLEKEKRMAIIKVRSIEEEKTDNAKERDAKRKRGKDRRRLDMEGKKDATYVLRKKKRDKEED